MADSNPFKAIVVDGKQLYHTGVEDRVRMVQTFNQEQCQAALQVDGLQKTVSTAISRRLRALDKQARAAEGGAA